MIVGINQAWFYPPSGQDRPNTNYGHDLFQDFSISSIEESLRYCNEIGVSVLGVWAFEGNSPEGLEIIEDIQGIREINLTDTFLSNCDILMRLANQYNVKIKWTLIAPNTEGETNQPRYDKIITESAVRSLFLRVATQFIRTLVQRYEQDIFYIDLINEMNYCIEKNYCTYEQGVNWINYMASNLKPHFGNSIKLTSSIAYSYPRLRNTSRFYGERYARQDNLLRSLNSNANIDYIDLHIYNDTGHIPERTICTKPLIIGEFGQSSNMFNNDLQNSCAITFLNNAKQSGYFAALGWQLIARRTIQRPQYLNYYYNTINLYSGVDDTSSLPEIGLEHIPRPVVGAIRAWIRNNSI